MRISDWSSDVCSSDLGCPPRHAAAQHLRGDPGRSVGWPHDRSMGAHRRDEQARADSQFPAANRAEPRGLAPAGAARSGQRAAEDGRTGDARRVRSEEHTSELQSLMRRSYAVFSLKKKKKKTKKKRSRRTTQDLLIRTTAAEPGQVPEKTGTTGRKQRYEQTTREP